MVRGGAYQDFLLIVLLVGFLHRDAPGHWDVLDFYSDQGRISTLANKCGLRAAAFDVKHDTRKGRSRAQRKGGRPARSFMDMNGEVGYVRLVCATQAEFFLRPTKGGNSAVPGRAMGGGHRGSGYGLLNVDCDKPGNEPTKSSSPNGR